MNKCAENFNSFPDMLNLPKMHKSISNGSVSDPVMAALFAIWS
jgi:hypothetical protein